MVNIFNQIIPEFSTIKKKILITHADVDHCGLLPIFDEIITNEKTAKCLEKEYNGLDGYREENPLHKPYINICKILTEYKPINSEKVVKLWKSAQTYDKPLTQTGFYNFGELNFEVYEGKGGHLPGEIVLIDYANHIAITGDIYINTHGLTSEQEKYKLIKELLVKLRDYNHVIEFFSSIDSMPYVSLQIENQGNTFDEDIDVKLFIERGCFADIDDIPEPGIHFLDEAVELKVPKVMFCGHHDADIEDFTNYPVPYIPQRSSIPFKRREEEIAEQQEEYRDMMEYVFCYDLRENAEDDILCFNIPYLKQHTKMFFPSYLFFRKMPKNIRYEIRSKHSPEVYKGTLEFADRDDG